MFLCLAFFVILLYINPYKTLKTKNALLSFILTKQGKKHSTTITNLKTVKGIRYFNTEKYNQREYIFDIWKKITQKFSYDFYDLPILEDFHIFQKSNINEAYDFKKNNRHLILRPEITPQLIKYLFFRKKKEKQQVAKTDNETETKEKTKIKTEIKAKRKKETINNLKSIDLEEYINEKFFEEKDYKYTTENTNKVLKLSTIGQCFRYEKPSHCRKREHYQWNVDIFGINNTYAEIELLSMLIYFFQFVKLTEKDILIKINDRKIIQQIIQKCFKTTFPFFINYKKKYIEINKILHILDKFHKIDKFHLKNLFKKRCPYLKKEKVHHFINVIQNINNPFHLDLFFNFEENNICANLKQLLSHFHYLGCSSFFQLDLTIARGLNYYRSIVFEIYYKHKELRSICGGGRYDFVLKKKNIFAVGFGMGDVVISNIIFEKASFLWKKNIQVVSYIPFFSNERLDVVKEFYCIEQILRNYNVSVYSLLQKNLQLSKALKKANSMNANFFLFLHPSKHNIFLKNLKTGEQIEASVDNVLAFFKK